MISISIDQELGRAKLRKLRDAVDDAVILDSVKKRLLAWVDENFYVGGLEKRWPALRPTTVMLQGGPTGRSRQENKPLARWRQMVTSKVTGNEVRIGFAKEIAKMTPWHHFGTSPYIIEPVKAKVLAALIPGGMRVSLLGRTGSGPKGDYLIFGKRVHHPGLPERPLIPSEGLTRKLVVDELNAMFAIATKAP